MDYKELIETLRLNAKYPQSCFGAWDINADAAATAIETLLAERDALECDLMALRTCSTCKNAEENKKNGKPCIFSSVCNGQYWQWRGPKKESGNDG